ncbi:hypothetical protein BRC2024_KCUCJSVR_CDS_0142 [Acinetobacter phage vB_AbaM_KissB]
MEANLSLPKEWVHILNAEKPLLSLEYLINDATLEDVYDALEMMEVQKYLKIEAEKFEDDNKG